MSTDADDWEDGYVPSSQPELEDPPKMRVRWEGLGLLVTGPDGRLTTARRTWVLRTSRGWMLDKDDDLHVLLTRAPVLIAVYNTAGA